MCKLAFALRCSLIRLLAGRSPVVMNVTVGPAASAGSHSTEAGRACYLSQCSNCHRIRAVTLQIGIRFVPSVHSVTLGTMDSVV